MPKKNKIKYTAIRKVIEKYDHVELLELEVQPDPPEIKLDNPTDRDDLRFKKHLAYNVLNRDKSSKGPLRIDASTPKDSEIKNSKTKFVHGAFSRSGRRHQVLDKNGEPSPIKGLADVRVRTDGTFNTISCAKGGEFQSSVNVVRMGKHLRYLTINEAERLMCWPDDHTKFGKTEDGKVYEIAESNRYEMTGNGIVSTVTKAIYDKYIKGKINGKLRILNTFTGVDGSCLALPRDEVKYVGFCEFAKFQTDVLRFHYPDVRNFGDITDDAIINEAPDHDLFFTSPPCQSFSIAGKQGGLDDPRGDLTRRTLEVIKANRPQFVIFENVKNFAQTKQGKVCEFVLEELGRLGYNVKINVLNSRDYGSWQIRERVFIFAELKEE